MNSSRFRLAMVIVALMLPGAALAQIIDTLTDALPSNACNGQPVVIDAPGTPDDCGQAIQADLPGVFPGATRGVAVYSAVAVVDARVRPNLARLDVSSSGGAPHIAECQYELNHPTDLTGVDRIEVGIEGDASPALPVDCLVIVTSQDVVGHTHDARLRVTATAPGTYALPMASFSGDFAFSLALVSRISFAVGECPLATCSGPFPARAYSVGPFRLVGNSTPARTGSWGRVKSLYR